MKMEPKTDLNEYYYDAHSYCTFSVKGKKKIS